MKNISFFLLIYLSNEKHRASATSLVIGNDNANDDDNGSTVQIISSK